MTIEFVEKGTTRRHTFFCVDRKRHTQRGKRVIEVIPKMITVFGEEIEGWIITTEEPVIDKTITLSESLKGLGVLHDNE